MMVSRITVVLSISLLLLFFEAKVEAQEEARENAQEEEVEEVLSLTEERRETLLFGIDAEVIELIDNLIVEKEKLLLDDVFATFKLSINPEIKIRAFRFFDTMEFEGAREDALEIAREPGESSRELTLEAIRYISQDRSAEAAEVFLPLLNNPDQSIARAAIRGLGTAGDDTHGKILVEKLDDPDYPGNLKSEIILSLGDLKYKEAVESLIEIVEDETEEQTWRRYACDALGKIGDPLAIPALRLAYESSDAILRSYAVSSLRYFDEPDTTAMLIQALRDSFWRVRVSAAQSLAERGATEAVPILIYKARKDPETNVKLEAVDALGKIGTIEAIEALRELFESDNANSGVRLGAMEALIEHDLEGSLSILKTVIQNEWEKEGSKILERTAFRLSLAESPQLKPLFLRFLDAGDLVIIIYGLRGIGRNGFSDLLERVEQLSGENNHRSIRRAALAALDQLRGNP